MSGFGVSNWESFEVWRLEQEVNCYLFLYKYNIKWAYVFFGTRLRGPDSNLRYTVLYKLISPFVIGNRHTVRVYRKWKCDCPLIWLCFCPTLTNKGMFLKEIYRHVSSPKSCWYPWIFSFPSVHLPADRAATSRPEQYRTSKGVPCRSCRNVQITSFSDIFSMARCCRSLENIYEISYGFTSMMYTFY